MSARDVILARVDEAMRGAEGAAPTPPASAAPLTTDAAATGDVLARFLDEARAVGTVVHTAPSIAAAGESLARVAARAPSVCRAVAWSSPLVDAVVAATRPFTSALTIVAPENAADADVGITEADALVAASGTLVLGAAAGRRRVTSLLPRIHVAVATADRLVPDLAAALRAVAAAGVGGACTTLVTGPSRTADIEKKLVVGVHGPCELHVIIVGAVLAAR